MVKILDVTQDYAVKDLSLAKEGKNHIRWAEDHMPVLMELRAEFEKNKPLLGKTLACCLHVTKETAVLMKTLKAGGAKVVLCGSNPLSTNDAVAAALADEGIYVYAWRGVNSEEYYRCVDRALDHKPHLTMDDGGDLVTRLHTVRKELISGVIAGTEETTTGVIRQRAMADEGILEYPVIAVNDAMTKHFFDNRYGTGQSTLDGILRATSVLLAGKNFVVAGYGWCGKGLAMRAKGMGASVIVTEIDPVKGIEAVMDGFRVMPMKEAAREADIIVTVTGNKNVVDKEDFEVIKNGCVIANSGHFDNEIDVKWLDEWTKGDYLDIRPEVREYRLPDRRKIYLLAEGRLVNLAAAEGHPSEVMDMSFANQATSARWLLAEGGAKNLENKVYPVPETLDREIARRKLLSLGADIDVLTKEQKEYLGSWMEGT